MASNASELNSTQQETLNNFLSLTSADLDIAKQFLQACSWNGEVAVSRFFDLNGDPTSLNPEKVANNSSNNANSSNINNNPNPNISSNNPTPSANAFQQSLLQSLGANLGDFGGLSANQLLQQMYGNDRQYVDNSSGFDPNSGVRAPDRAFREQLLPSNYEQPGSGYQHFQQQRQDSMKNFSSEWQRGTSGTGKQPGKRTQKTDHLAKMFAEPDYRYKGTFDQAKDAGQEKNAWVLVNVQSADDFTSHCLNRDVWNHSTFSETVESCFIFFQHTREQSKGEKFMTLYHITPDQVPYLCIIDPNTGRKEHTFKMPPSPNDVEKIRNDIIEFLNDHPNPRAKPKKVIPQAPSSKQQVLSTEDEMLQAAIAASMADNKEDDTIATQSLNHNNNDNIKSTEKNKDDNDIDMTNKQTSSNLNNNNNNNYINKTEDINNNNEIIDKKTYELDAEPQANDPNATALRVRMPNGSVIQRRFKKDSKVEQLYTWIYLTEGKEVFTLFQPMPRVTLDNDKEKTLQEMGLIRATVICSFDT